jgi:hypothetical protein
MLKELRWKPPFQVAQNTEVLMVLRLEHIRQSIELKGIFGEVQTIIAIYNNCKLMLIDISPHDILVGLALQRSFDCEDDNFVEKIKQLITAKVEAN